jgi:class 3 adenylate cyclase/predicted ATPase
MDFVAVLDQVIALLRQRGRMTYRTLQRQFQLDDDALHDLTDELFYTHPDVRDDAGRGLVWTGDIETPVSPASPASLHAPPSAASAPPEAERRQLTILFCDLVASTALSRQLDPEDYRAAVRAYQAACAPVIERFDGHIAQYLGDGLLVYFGYPLAHEDNAQRAVRSGLAMIEAMGPLTTRLEQQHGVRLAIRVGIHTGPVVVGEMGAGSRREQLALGETPNIAARLESLAAPNTVVISAALQQLVQGYFICDDLGAPALKGVDTPFQVYRVVRESGAQSRLDVPSPRGLTPLIGREAEVTLLLDRWTQMKDGRGQVVLLSGEAGIGKSRLVQVLKEHLASEPHMLLECRCSPYSTNSPLYPVIDLWQRVLRFETAETPADKLHRLEQTLAQYRLPLAETMPLFTALLSLPDDRYPALALTPHRQRQKTLEALLALLMAYTAQEPLLLIVEDLHCVDPSTLECLSLLVDQGPTARMLTLCTFRPPFTPPWSSRAHIAQLTLTRLPRPQVERIVTAVARGKALPAEVVQQIVTKSDGVPLFVEELTKMVLESGLLRELEDHYVLMGPLPPLAIPATLHDSLMARLDRLGTARQVAQLGAMLGREFSYALIHAVSPFDETSLSQALATLVDAEVLYQRGVPPQTRYLFKHALIQEVAYHSLLRGTRQHQHQQIAQVLEQRFPATTETQPELLAQHYTEAGLIVQAMPYWQQAGQRAAQHSAHAEAISHLTKGLALLQALPATAAHAQQELLLHSTLGGSLTATKGYAAPEVGKVYTRAYELCQHVGTTPQLFPILVGLWGFYNTRAELAAAWELATQCATLIQSGHNHGGAQVAHYMRGEGCFHRGELTQAHAYFEEGLALDNPQHHSSDTGNEPRVACLCIAAYALWALGYPDQALQRCHAALTFAQECSHPFSLAFALYGTTRLHQCRREVDATHEYATTLIALSTEHGFAHRVAVGRILQGWALAEQGQGEEGSAQIRQGLAAHHATGAKLYRPYFLSVLAEACEKAGQADEGLPALTEAFTAVDKTGERANEAELYRLKGQLTRQKLQGAGAKFHVETGSESGVRSAESEVEACFWQALEIARHQHAKSLELRAAMSLCRLWQQQGKRVEACALLAPIYGWFTEGFDTADLQEAKALLDELGA